MVTVIEAAIHAFEQGWSPIPIRMGKKRPLHSDWNNTKYKTIDEIKSAFEDANLGVLLGDYSNGLVDVDLDAPEAQSLSDGFLPITSMVHGRESSPRSHYWYLVPEFVKTVTFKDPLLAKDDPGRATLVEIRGTGGQTLLPPSIHPSGEQYRWLGGWKPPAAVSYKDLEKQVKWLAAAALLARYWPGEGHRHEASMALAGGLLKLGDPELERDAEAFVASVALAGGDEEGMDRQDDVVSSRVALAKGQRVKGWPSLAKIIDKKIVKQVYDWLDPEANNTVEEEEGAFTRELIAPYMTGDIKPEPMLVNDILYASKVTWLQGEPGNGKTIFALWLAKLCMEQGFNVMMIDEESGPKMIGERLAGLNVDPELTHQKFWYYPFSAINVLDSDHRLNFNAALAESNPQVIIFDSVADILSQAGLEENNNDHVTSLIKHFVVPLRSQNVACLFIDHMAKSMFESSWARGAGQKKSKTDAAWTFTATKAFDKQHIGRVSLKRAKDRLGDLPLSHLFDMGGDGKGNIIIKPTEIVRELRADKVNPLEARIINHLKAKAPSEDEGLTTRELGEQISGNTNQIYKTMRNLENKISHLPIEIAKHGRSKIWFYAGEMEIDFTEDD